MAGINIGIPHSPEPLMKPRITVVGVGGAGGNAVNNMIQAKLEGVEFVVANTDAQALAQSRTERRIQLGANTTRGLGAGARPDIGRSSAEEAFELIAKELEGSNMAFITAGMGGGTGTGAAPVVARVAHELGILTVGVVTKPFDFEGHHRMRLAVAGIEELSQFVDTLIVIPNQNLFRVANEKTTFADAFKMADDVLYSGVRSVTDLMIMPGLINLDFADVKTVMSEMGRAMMGTGEAGGERRALDAAEAAIANPLLEDACMKGAKGVLINITGGEDVTLFEVDEAANRIASEVDGEAHIIFGSCFDASLEGKMRVSVVATGIAAELQAARPHGHGLSRTVHAVSAPAPAQPARAPEAKAEPVPVVAVRAEPAAPAPTPAVAQQAEPAERPPLFENVAQRPAATAPAPDVFIPEPPVNARNVEAPRGPARPLVEPPRRAADLSMPSPMASRAEPRVEPRMESRAEPPKPVEQARQSRGAGLFRKVTGLPFGPRASAPEPAPERPVERPRGIEPSVKVEPADRSSVSQLEDELEIPAFLRRQAN